MNDLHLKRKGTFLRNFYSNPNLILQNDKGQLTEASTAALSWGEPAPVTKDDALHLAVMGEVLYQRAEQRLSQSASAFENSSIPQASSRLVGEREMPGGAIDLQLLSQGLLRVPLAMKGKWCHPEYGNVEFTEKDFDEVIDNYKNNRLGFEPYLTFGHLDADIASTDAQRKNGSLESLSIHNDVFYGDFSINEKTTQLVENGEYEYSSGEFIRNFMDKDTGDTRGTAFLRVALTNAPFLPFKEKVQLLSQGLQPKISTQLPFVVALSTSVLKEVGLDTTEQKQITNPEVTNMSKETKQEHQQNLSVDNVVVEPQTPTATSGSHVTPNLEGKATRETVADAVVASTVSKAPVTITNGNSDTLTTMNSYVDKPPVVTHTVTAEDLQALANQLNEIKSGYQDQLTNANTTITELTKQVNELNTKVGAQEIVTHAFSQSMSRAQEEVLYNKMVEGGINPALVQRFSQLKSAIDKSATKTIKLSTKAADGTDTEAETSLVESIAELMMEVSATEPIAYQQFGHSVAKVQDTGDFSEIIQKNRELAKTRTLGVH